MPTSIPRTGDERARHDSPSGRLDPFRVRTGRQFGPGGAPESTLELATLADAVAVF